METLRGEERRGRGREGEGGRGRGGKRERERKRGREGGGGGERERERERGREGGGRKGIPIKEEQEKRLGGRRWDGSLPQNHTSLLFWTQPQHTTNINMCIVYYIVHRIALHCTVSHGTLLCCSNFLLSILIHLSISKSPCLSAMGSCIPQQILPVKLPSPPSPPNGCGGASTLSAGHTAATAAAVTACQKETNEDHIPNSEDSPEPCADLCPLPLQGWE